MIEHTKPPGSGSRPSSGHELFLHSGRNAKEAVDFISFSFFSEAYLLCDSCHQASEACFICTSLYKILKNTGFFFNGGDETTWKIRRLNFSLSEHNEIRTIFLYHARQLWQVVLSGN